MGYLASGFNIPVHRAAVPQRRLYAALPASTGTGGPTLIADAKRSQEGRRVGLQGRRPHVAQGLQKITAEILKCPNQYMVFIGLFLI